MVKRGRKLESKEQGGIRHPITARRIPKKYMWHCGTCNAEYYFQYRARECEIGHLPKPKLETYAEFRAKQKAKWEAIKKFREENKDLEEREYQAIRDKMQVEYEKGIPDFDEWTRLREEINQHMEKWHR